MYYRQKDADYLQQKKARLLDVRKKKKIPKFCPILV